MSQSKRMFFIALLPPQDIQDQITQIKEYFAQNYHTHKALNSPPHITLQSPFEWSLDDLPMLIQCLENFAISHHFIPITLANFAAFPPRVIYIDVLQSPELLQLQSDLSNHLETTLNIVDSRSKNLAFVPHVTVAFKDLTKDNFHKAWPEFENKSLLFEFVATEVTLLLYDQGKWQINKQFPLLLNS